MEALRPPGEQVGLDAANGDQVAASNHGQ